MCPAKRCNAIKSKFARSDGRDPSPTERMHLPVLLSLAHCDYDIQSIPMKGSSLSNTSTCKTRRNEIKGLSGSQENPAEVSVSERGKLLGRTTMV